MKSPLQTADQAKIDEAKTFIASFSSLVLSTVDESSRPHGSYAPYISNQGKLYVYVSGLARHAETLKQGYASVLFVEDESNAKSLFARTRLTMDCEVERISPQKANHRPLLDQFEAERGATIKMLRSLPDFVLFELQPQRARFVTGFGAAFDLSDAIEYFL